MNAKTAPLITVCFDDGRETAFRFGAPVLEKFGARGTFFPITSKIGGENEHGKYADWSTIERAARSGHEIGSHTHHHSKNILYWKRTSQEADIERSVREFQAHGIKVSTFAYPFGFHDTQLEKIVRQFKFTAARTVFPGINRTGAFNPLLLFSFMVEKRHSLSQIKRGIEQLTDPGDWLILTFHHLDNKTFISTPPDLFEEMTHFIADKKIKIVTLSEGLERHKKN